MSRSQIVAALGLKSDSGALSEWLKGVPAPEWTARPNAKDELRSLAIELRTQGHSYREIQQLVPVSKSTLSLWLRDVLVDEPALSRLADRVAAGHENAATAIRARREAKERRIIGDARTQIPAPLDESALFMAALALYWAEGTKAKEWNPSEGVTLINSDLRSTAKQATINLLLGIGRDELAFRVAIHETGDVARAERFWADVVGIEQAELQRTSLKRHERRLTRRLPTEAYVGCLCIKVRKSTDFNRQIAGWWQGLVAAVATVEAPSGMV